LIELSPAHHLPASMRNSSHLNEEMNFLEMESDRTQHVGAPRPRSRDKRENTIRPVYLLMIVLVAAIFFSTLFMDSIEIKLSNKYFKPKNKQKKSVVMIARATG
jgi:hypothetical protein